MADTTYTFDEFKRMSKELIDAAPTLDADGLENGMKCLGIAYLSIEDTEINMHQAAYALQLTLRQIEKVALAFPETPRGSRMRPMPSLGM